MNAKLTKVVAMASLAAFLSVGIGANVAQAKDYRYKVDANPYMVQNDDGTWGNEFHSLSKTQVIEAKDYQA